MLGWTSDGMDGAIETDSEGGGRKVRRSWSFIRRQRLDRLLFARRTPVESWLLGGGTVFDVDGGDDVLLAASSGPGMKSGSNSCDDMASKN